MLVKNVESKAFSLLLVPKDIDYRVVPTFENAKLKDSPWSLVSENPLDLFDGAKKPDLTLISETPVENTMTLPASALTP